MILLVVGVLAALAIGSYFLGSKWFDDEWEQRYVAIQEDACRRIGNECLVRFSAYGEDFLGLPANNFNEVAYDGKIRFIVKPDSWHKQGYQSTVLVNPTWLDVAKAANEMIKATDDTHHVYLEDFEETAIEGDVAIAEFIMGS